ncbi:hypothetical protein KA005_53190 [bacterium]|nr:hypothetical protein [bacterium]
MSEGMENTMLNLCFVISLYFAGENTKGRAWDNVIGWGGVAFYMLMLRFFR